MYEPSTEEREEPPCIAAEISAIIKKMKINKAPDWDSTEVLVIRKAFEYLKSKFVNLFNKDSMRPNSYRQGSLRTPMMVQSSYRETREKLYKSLDRQP